MHGDTKPRNLRSQWGAPCPLDAHARVAGTASHAPAAKVCLQVSAGEPCVGFLSHEPGLDYIHGRVGVVCPRWHLTDVTKDALSDHVWSWLFFATIISLPRLVFYTCVLLTDFPKELIRRAKKMFQAGWAGIISQPQHLALRWKWVWCPAHINTGLTCQNKVWESAEAGVCIYSSWCRRCWDFLSYFLSKMKNICQMLSICGNT